MIVYTLLKGYLCTLKNAKSNIMNKTIRTFIVLVQVSWTISATASSVIGDGMVVGQPADTSRVIDLDELTVVARPKEIGRLRSLPLSSNVLTNREMLSLGVNDLSEMSAYVPSFVMPSYGSRLTSSVYVRGIGSRSGSPAVGVYYNGMPLVCKSAINSHFYQIDRVDVLRGPQGTLYGINAEGGIVRVHSKDPLRYQGTDIRMSLGTGLYGNTEVAHYHRPSDKLAFSTAGYYNGQRGFFRNTLLDGRADLVNEAGGNARIIWLPTEMLKLDFTVDYQYTNQNGFPYGEYNAATNVTADPAVNIMNGYKRQMVNTALNISYDFGVMQLSSVSSYQHLADLMQMDQDYLPEDYLRLLQRERMNAIVQEITFSRRSESRWQHTSGVFFSKQWLNTDAPVYFGDAMNTSIVSAMGMPPQIASGMSLTDNMVSGVFDTPQLNIGIYHESNIQLPINATLTLGLRYDYQHVGIDYNTESRFRMAYSGVMYGRPMNTDHLFRSIMQNETGRDYSQLLPKIGLTFNLDDKGNNVYATVSKGFRAGGYNLQMFSDIFQTELSGMGKQLMSLMREDVTVEHSAADYDNINATISYEPETSWNYEAGAHLNLFGNRVHTDVAAFFMQIQNQQLSVMAGNYGYGRMMVNAGRSSSAGAELSVRGSAFNSHLSWAATYGYVYSTFRNYTDSVSVVDAKGKHNELRDYRGHHVPFVPRHTFSAMADYRLDLAGNRLLKTVTFGANVTGNGKTYWDSENEHSQNLYATLGAHVAFGFGAVKVNLWGRNLTDTRYNTFLINSAVDGVERSFAQRGNPLQVGVDVDIKL